MSDEQLWVCPKAEAGICNQVVKPKERGKLALRSRTAIKQMKRTIVVTFLMGCLLFAGCAGTHEYPTDEDLDMSNDTSAVLCGG